MNRIIAPFILSAYFNNLGKDRVNKLLKNIALFYFNLSKIGLRISILQRWCNIKTVLPGKGAKYDRRVEMKIVEK
jgi:hypothetical protein